MRLYVRSIVPPSCLFAIVSGMLFYLVRNVGAVISWRVRLLLPDICENELLETHKTTLLPSTTTTIETSPVGNHPSRKRRFGAVKLDWLHSTLLQYLRGGNSPCSFMWSHPDGDKNDNEDVSNTNAETPIAAKNSVFVEPMCRIDELGSRFLLFPIKHPDLWNMYKQHVASFWTADEIDLSPNLDDWNDRLTDNERHFISMVLAFFASADGIVVENLTTRFCKEITIPEARCFYAFQMAMESIHQEMYCLLIDTYVANLNDRKLLFSAHNDIPSVKRKAQWAEQYIVSSGSFAKRLAAFSAVEGIFFFRIFLRDILAKETRPNAGTDILE